MAVHSSSPALADARAAAAPPDLRTPVVLVALGSAVAWCAALAIRPDDATHGPVVCPFRLATGLPCPGCGMTRAWVFMAHGRVGDALYANPFVIVTLPVALMLVLLVVVALVRHRPLPDLGRITRSWATKGVVVGWLGFAVVRVLAVVTGHATV